MEWVNARAGPLADDQIDTKILHRWIEDFFDSGLQAMDFVEEENFFLFERSQNGGKVTFAFEQRAGAGFDGYIQLVGNDLRQSRLAEAGRTVEQYVVERFATAARGFDCDSDVFFYFFLADVFAQRFRANAGVQTRVVFQRRAGNDTAGICGIVRRSACEGFFLCEVSHSFSDHQKLILWFAIGTSLIGLAPQSAKPASLAGVFRSCRLQFPVWLRLPRTPLCVLRSRD